MPNGSVRAALLAVVALGAPALAGPLNPPAGPVAPSLKTLDQVEPRVPLGTDTTPGDADSVFKITASGSYYLTQNLSAQNAKHGIEIAAPRVTLDLNGFTLIGLVFQGSSLDAITVSAGSPDQIRIENGSIFFWGDRGIDAQTTNGLVLRDLFVRGCGSDGIVAGFDSLIDNCVSEDNGGDGIRANERSFIDSCIASENDGTGINSIVRGKVSDCIGNRNLGYGILIGAGGRAESCVADLNTLSGFFVGGGAVAVGCVSVTNMEHGFEGGARASIYSSLAQTNQMDGISVDFGSTVVGNRCVENVDDGIIAGDNCFVDSNHLLFNGDIAAYAECGSFLIRNFAKGNPTGFVGPNPLGCMFGRSGIGAFESSVDAASGPYANVDLGVF